MGTSVTVAKSNLPAHLQKAAAKDEIKEFSGGVQSGFPVLSYRGKVWRFKISGEEQVYVNDDGDAIQTIEAVLIKSNPRLSKTFYKGKYSEGDSGKPQCWSSDGIRPDTDVPNPVNSLCDSCPMNVWGSRTSDEGKKMKACQDVRRVSLIFRHELEAVATGEKDLSEVPIMLLRIPPASINPLKDYAERVLAPKGASPFMLYTKIGFDTDASYPKLTFKGAQWLDEAEFGAVQELRDSDMVRRILDTSAEHMTEGTTDEASEVASKDHAPKAEVAEPAPSGVSNTEEQHYSESADEDEDDDIAPPSRPAAVEEQAAQEIEQPPKPKAAKSKAVAKSKSKEPEVESPDAGDTDIDEMLSSILD